MSLQFLPAGTSDALTLTGISKRSFETDVSVGGPSKGGPPGYMSVPFHTKMARMKHLYKLTDNGLVVGGAILSLKDDVLNIERIFVAPEYFRKGYGLFMMKQIEELFSNVKKFLLDTPDWNVRTNSLYKKLGYKELRRGKGLVYYVKSENE
jgi:ribosomal protein S18 acetylase RimI-like enzyme